MTGANPKSTIDDGPMHAWQWLAVAITVGLNGLDGFDVLSISFASPGIAKEWGGDQSVLGWILSMELLGMAVGSVLLGGVADKAGRRPTMLGCLVAMTIGMHFAGGAASVNELLGWRLLTGLGIGGMLAAINAAAAEFSNNRYRGLAMSLMVIGYPIGGVVGGLVVQQLLVAGGWRDVFSFGAWATAAFIPLVWFFVPETPAFLDRRRPEGALQRVNRTLVRFGHAAVAALSVEGPDAPKKSVADIFKPALIATTLLITFAYFTHITSFYFILKWVPKIVVDMGFEPRAAAGVLTWANVGGATGGAVFGMLAIRFGLKRLTMIALVVSAGMIIWFGSGAGGLTRLSMMVAATGFFTNSAIVGLYSLFAKVFPTHVRATGTGFAIGLGRGGAALAPVLAGYLFAAGFGLQTVALCMGVGSLLAAIALALLKERAAN
ncbi:MFS transporter [Sphingopyxis terrae]|uniref:MFS transporter n=1 Tax=Sphingopyxis terrae TaxID=33052 RepID=UPI002A110F83|nr:MFS transporter [Sphingopyxis terrae]MDX8356457.1 MFS transporter [Sphingopyxis terrae]